MLFGAVAEWKRYHLNLPYSLPFCRISVIPQSLGNECLGECFVIMMDVCDDE